MNVNVNTKAKRRNFFWKNLNRILSSTLFFVLSLIFVRTFIIDWSVVPSGSMSKTFLTGDVVISNKMAYGYYSLLSIPIVGVHFGKKKFVNLTKINRGDVIVFCGKKDCITKRVIGLPGDIVEWDHQDLIINGESTVFNQDGSLIYPTDERFLLTKNHHDLNIDESMRTRFSRIPLGSNKYLKITTLYSDKFEEHPKFIRKVPEGHVFVVGDNRYPQYSWDSRDYLFGEVPMSQITGKVTFRLFGSDAKVFNRKRSLVANVIMFPYLILRYISHLNFGRFGTLGDQKISLPNASTQDISATQNKKSN